MDLTVFRARLYDSTFTMHRLSPLHLPPSTPFLSDTTLQIHAHAFTNTLKRDVLRGVQVSFGDGEVPKAGHFLQSQWSLLQKSDDLSSPERTHGSSNTSQGVFGVGVDVEYERITYKALMIRQQALQSQNATGEVHLPLLLTQMPSSLRDILLDYLATAFDTHAEQKKLSSDFLGQTTDDFLNIVSQGGEDQLKKAIKDVQLTVGFKSPIAPSLRSLDITVKSDDIASFLEEGKRFKKKAKSDTLDQGANASQKTARPFMEAICQYLRAHLAMDMSHEKIFVSKIACGSFTLVREGRVNIKSPVSFEALDGLSGNSDLVQRAVSNLIGQLVGESTIVGRKRPNSSGIGLSQHQPP